MTGKPRDAASDTATTVRCGRCGAAFACDPTGPCWCKDETARLPMPQASSSAGCLCPDCLRAAAVQRAHSTSF